MTRPCHHCGRTTHTFPKHVPSNGVFCRDCFEREICRRTGARIELRNGQRVFVGIGLKKAWDSR